MSFKGCKCHLIELTGILQWISFMPGILQGYGKTPVLDRGVMSFKWNSPIQNKHQNLLKLSENC
jgi:hypothetical protein